MTTTHKRNNHPDLTQLQYDFTKHYISNGFNAHRAAISAGYGKQMAVKEAYKLTAHPIIKPLVEKAKQSARDATLARLSLGIENRLIYLKQVITQFIPLDGTPLDDKQASVAIKAIAEINKIAGDYAPDRKLSVTVDMTKDKLKEARKVYDEF